MHELSQAELYKALEHAKSIDENTGRTILEKFQIDQPALAQTIFNIFPGIIAQKSRDMAHLFMDMCFDIICVYQHAFGKTPIHNEMNQEWLEKQAALLDTELQALIPEKRMDPKLRKKLQERLAKRANDETMQHGLVDFMNAWIDDFTAETPGGISTDAIKVTQGMVFVTIRLFNNLYAQAAK